VNPNKDDNAEQKANQEGISPVLINVREKDQVKQQKAFMGAVLHYGDKKEVIPFIKPGAAMEYSLSTSIKKMTISNKLKIGFLEGHNETSLNSMVQTLQALSVLYDVEPVNLKDSSVNLNKYKTLVMVYPKDTVKPVYLKKLDDYLATGKNLYMALSRVEGNLQKSMGSGVYTGFEDWLEQKGVKISPSFIIDENCGSVMVNQQSGGMTFQTQMKFPYLPLITKFAEHPATKGLTSVFLQFPSPIDYVGKNSNVTFTPLATTSEKSGTENPPVYFDVSRNWRDKDFPLSKLTVAGLLSGKIVGDQSSRIIVVSDGNFPNNGEGREAKQISGDNLNFIVNAIDWLSDDTGLIDLRTKEVNSRPLAQLEDGTKTLLKYLNFLLPIILIIVFGFIRWQYRMNLRMKRMNEKYI
jgi:gliding-associated putative ABC transporter substrate-binding component GldG